MMNTTLSQSEIYLVKSLKVILPEPTGGVDTEIVSTVARNLHSLGYGLSSSLLQRLSLLSVEDVTAWYDEALPVLRKMVGEHRVFTPMYPNFPKQVMEASDAELFFNAMTHYHGFVLSDMLGDPNLLVLPKYEKEARPVLEEFHKLRWIELGSDQDFDSIFTELAGSNGSLSEADREILLWFIENRPVEDLLPAKVPQKETLAFLVAKFSQPDCLLPEVKTATDVLRVAVAMSDGDMSLAEPTKFRNFSKRERRFLLGCVENAGNSRTEDMLRWKNRWIRLAERLHPGDYRNRFPETFTSFDILRNGKPFKTFNSKIEEAIAKGDAAATTQLLCARPGDFARRLDHVLRTHKDQATVLTRFLSVAAQVSTPVLFQTWNHFRSRNEVTSRAFFPKGNAAKVQFKESVLPPISVSTTDAVVSGLSQVLQARFAELPSLGKVYVDSRLKDQIVPFSQRSASKSLRCIARGSRFDLPDGDTIRFFCWWKNLDGGDDELQRVDLDLSASMFNSDWQSTGDISYYNLRQDACYHSGDITSAPEGACEFIDISLSSVLKMGARYVVMSVLAFSGQPFLTLPECFSGWMMRKQPNSGEVFEARTVQDKIDITASSRTCVPVIIDATDRKVYWTDLGLKNSRQLNNAAGNSVGFSQIGRAIVELRKPSLHDLFSMHAEVRGELVENEDEAETLFGLHEGTVTAFDTDTILSDYLG